LVNAWKHHQQHHQVDFGGLVGTQHLGGHLFISFLVGANTVLMNDVHHTCLPSILFIERKKRSSAVSNSIFQNFKQLRNKYAKVHLVLLCICNNNNHHHPMVFST
jgi:hypothetical protein